jgi:hypothetical protein
MRRIAPQLFVLLAVAVFTGRVAAQRPDRGSYGTWSNGNNDKVRLLAEKAVQEELKLSEEQVKKVNDLSSKRGDVYRNRDQNLSREDYQKLFQEQGKATEKSIAEVLKPEQVTRLGQIALQQQGMNILSDPEVATVLQLTAEQKETVKGIQDELRTALRNLGNTDESRKKGDELRKAQGDKMAAVLTESQKSKVKEMLGAPFTGEIRSNARGGAGNFRRPPNP